MFDLFRKTILMSIGFSVMTREKIEEVGKKLVEEAKLNEIEGKQFIEEILKKTDETRQAVDKLIHDQIDNVVKKLSLPTRSEIADIDARLRKLENASSERKKEC